MKQHPTLFKAPMVIATLEGRKTMTRRIITRRNSLYDGVPATAAAWDNLNWASPDIFVDRGPSPAGNPGPYLHVPDKDGDCVHRIYPRVQPGDVLWGRETWQGPILSDDGLEFSWENGLEAFKNPKYCVYRATDKLDAIDEDGNELGWRPAIHMPRWASRLELPVIKVRSERLQQITVDDACAEGVDNKLAAEAVGKAPDRHDLRVAALHGFSYLWETIHGPGSWALDPWLWIYEWEPLR